MSKNLIPQIAQMLGVEIGEKFQIKEYGERIYRFANSGLQLIYDKGWVFRTKEEAKAALPKVAAEMGVGYEL